MSNSVRYPNLITLRRFTDYATAFWAVHRLGGAALCVTYFTLALPRLLNGQSVTNPGFGLEELTVQLQETKPLLIITQGNVLPVVYSAASNSGLSTDRIVLFDRLAKTDHALEVLSIHDLIDYAEDCRDFSGLTEKRLAEGEGKTKIAVYFNSSGTTGIPKIIGVTHYAFIANILQAVYHDKSTHCRRYRPRDVSCAGTCIVVD